MSAIAPRESVSIRQPVERARAIEANGPDPSFRELGSSHLPPAEGFSTVIGDGRPCGTGTPEMAAREMDLLFPDEGGPPILEVSVPAWIIETAGGDCRLQATEEAGLR
jgi:hypothetical protein